MANNLQSVNLLDIKDVGGDDVVKNIISTFSCKNDDVEHFIKAKAVQFAKGHLNGTYFVFDENLLLQGVYSIAIKLVSINVSDIGSERLKSRIRRYARFDPSTGKYLSASYLIGQFGKNSNIPKEDCIPGHVLMDTAFKTLKGLQRRVGGGIVWLECEEDNENAISFYEKEGFTTFSFRESEDGKVYKQMVKAF